MNHRKQSNTRLTVIIAVLAFIFAGVFIHNVHADDGISLPTVFCNDEEWYRYESYPALVMGYDYFVPVSVFEYFDNIIISYVKDNKSGDFFISNTKTSNYISYHDKNRIRIKASGYDYSEEIYMITNLYKGERYVPLQTFCTVLELGWEIYENSDNSGVYSVRITDGNQRYNFNDMINRRINVTAQTTINIDDVLTTPPQVTTVPPATTPPITTTGRPDTVGTGTTPPPPPVTTAPPEIIKRPLYLTFDGSLDQNLPALLDALGDNRAMFFVGEGDLTGNGEAIASIIASGHTAGIMLERREDYTAEDYLARLEELNTALSRRIKQTLSLVGFNGGSLGFDGEISGTLYEAGYVIWDTTIDADGASPSQRLSGLYARLQEMHSSGIPAIVRLSTGDAGIIPGLLGEPRVSDYYNLRQITYASKEYNDIS